MYHYILLGETGVGKSSMTKVMFPYYRRVVVLDHHREYSDGKEIGASDFAATGFEVITGFDALADRITRDPFGEWRISFRTDIDAEWSAAIILLYQLQKKWQRSGETPKQLLVIIEEIGLFSSAHKAPKWLTNLWNYGRHYSITAIGIIREATETHKILRINSRLIFFRTLEIPTTISKSMEPSKVSAISRLTPYDAQARKLYPFPLPNVHYITHPDNIDILARLRSQSRAKIVLVD